MNKGTIILPTGTGKTMIQVSILLAEMQEKQTSGRTGVYGIAAHRILLCRQLLKRLLEEASDCGLDFDILSIGSDKLDGDTSVYKDWTNGKKDALNCRVLSTTDSGKIKQFINDRPKGRHLILVSTYHSISRLQEYTKKGCIDLLLCDEAHTTTGKGFREDLDTLLKNNILKVYYFTATPKFKGTEKGMRDKETYGSVLYWKPLREMVDTLEIIPPKFHFIRKLKGNPRSDEASVARAIIAGYSYHESKVSARAKGQPLGAKLLVSCNGIPQAQGVFRDARFQDYCRKQGVEVFLFTSSGYGRYNGTTGGQFQEGLSRKDVYNRMVSAGESKAILLHIRMLTEGIDVPSITGVMPLRMLETVSLLQTCGRAARLDVRDREMVYREGSDPVTPSEAASLRKRLVKPVYNLVLPIGVLEEYTHEGMAQMIRDIMGAYDMTFEELLEEDPYVGFGEDDPEDIVSGAKKPETLGDTEGKDRKEFEHWEEDLKFSDFKDTLEEVLGDATNQRARLTTLLQ